MADPVEQLLKDVARWASNQGDILAVALVGSHARGSATPDSDVDLVILAQDPGRYLRVNTWVRLFGRPVRHTVEDYGALTSLRVLYDNQLQIEYGIAGEKWPLDESAQTVIASGMKVLFDPGGAMRSSRARHPKDIRTERLLLRQWRESDREPFAAMNADPRVMEHFAAPLSGSDSDAFADRIAAHFVERGFGLWAIEIPGVAPFAGFCGLSVPTFTAPFAPCVEIGWRLAAERWDRGYATEAARAVLAYGFGTLAPAEIVSFTTTANVRSRRVMERIGMQHDSADDFDYPGYPPDHPRRRHVLYRIRSDAKRVRPI